MNCCFVNLILLLQNSHWQIVRKYKHNNRRGDCIKKKFIYVPRETNKLTGPNKLCTYMKGNRRMQELCKSVREMTLEVCCWWRWWWLGGGGGGAGVVCAEFSRHNAGKALNQLWKNVGFVPLGSLWASIGICAHIDTHGDSSLDNYTIFLRLQKCNQFSSFSFHFSADGCRS